MLFPRRVTVPVPILRRLPVPDITPLKVEDALLPKSTFPEPFNWILLYTFAPEEVEMLLPADRLMLPLPFTLPDPPGSRIKPPLPVLVMLASIIIFLWASKVKSLELFDEIEAWTVIFPSCEPPPPVWTVTLLEDNAVSNVPTSINASSPVEVKLPLTLLSLPEPMVML